MLGTVDAQGDMFRGDHYYLDYIGRNNIYGWLAENGFSFFRDTDFKDLYVLDNGRTSVPPSQMLILMMLQCLTNSSDAAAIESSKFDLRWRAALGLSEDQTLCCKSTLVNFRSHLLLHEKGDEILHRSLEILRSANVLKKGKIKVAIDTTPIWGRGAVKDTYNLVADGIVKVLRAIACYESSQNPCSAPTLVSIGNRYDLSRYLECSSIKGATQIDWKDSGARKEFLKELVTDARRAVRAGKEILKKHPAEKPSCLDEVQQALDLLLQLISQDVEENESGEMVIKQGVDPERVCSVHDPEMRHGRKSANQRFNGHKGELVVDTESGAILDASVKPGNSHDSQESLEAIERAEQRFKAVILDDAESDAVGIETTVGDCAYGTADNRCDFADADRELHAKQAVFQNQGRFTKDDFPVDEETGKRTCPGGHTAEPRYRTKQWRGKKVKTRYYQWDEKICMQCPLKDQCTRSTKSGRTIEEHPEEELLNQAREFQKTEAFRESFRARQKVEHRIARMVQLGARQAKYFGREKSALQWKITAAVANLTLVIGVFSQIFRDNAALYIRKRIQLVFQEIAFCCFVDKLNAKTFC